MILLGLGALSVALGDGCYKKRVSRALLWGGLYSGLFHSWLLSFDPVLWLFGLTLRSSVWALVVLPPFLLHRFFTRKKPAVYRDAASWGVGLFLVSWAQLSTPFGFDWEMPIAALAYNPAFLSLLPWLGLPGLSGLLGMVMALVFSRESTPRKVGLGLGLLWAGVSVAIYSASPKGLTEEFPRVALLQTGWTQQQKWDPAYTLEAKRRLFDLTDRARRQGAELVVWPETAWPQSTLSTREHDKKAIADLSKRLGVSLLVSSLEKEPSGWGNSVCLVVPEDGFGKEYRKRRLLPVWEYWPVPDSLEKTLRRSGWVRESSRYKPGTQEPTFALGTHRYAVMICYESTVPKPAQSLAGELDFLVVVSNGAVLYSEFAKEAHFRSAILRAVQTRTAVLQASNNGVTGIIDGRGVVLERLPVGFTGPEILLSR